MPRALITGITGQDGSYLAELLVGKGYSVHGLARDPAAAASSERLAAVADRITIHRGDLLEGGSLQGVVSSVAPDEVYNLAAVTFVGGAWSDPVAIAETTALGAVRLLEAVRTRCPGARVLQASSSDMFGRAAARSSPQGLSTPLEPVNPYGAAKAYAHSMVSGYREAHGLHASTAILFNHESPRRGLEFVTRKITRAVAEIAAGRREELRLGSLEARRDWGFAGDYVDALWRILQHDAPRDFVVGTGVAHSVREFVDRAFGAAGLEPERHLVVDPALIRPIEIPELRADTAETRSALGWEPTVALDELVEMMVAADRASLGP